MKILEGNRGKRRIPREPKARPGVPEKPEDLDPIAGEFWDSLVPELDVMGILTLADRAALTVLCRTWSLYVQAAEDVRANGWAYSAGAQENPRPAVTVMHKALTHLRAMLREFGLTPSARASLAVPAKPAAPSKLQQMLDRRRRKP